MADGPKRAGTDSEPYSIILLRRRALTANPSGRLVSGATMSTQSAKRVMVSNDRVSRVIFDYAARIGAAQDLDALLVLNAGMARGLVGADRCSIWLLDTKNSRMWTKVAHGVQELQIPIGQGLVGACVARNEAILVNDTSQDDRFLRNVDIETGYATKSVLALPLHGVDGKPIGALQVLNKPGGFSAEDVDLLGLCASYAASTLETQRLRKEAEVARLLLREMEIARDVQRHLLPQALPPIPGLDYAGYCRSAELVGGDYYDFLPMPDGGFLFTLGDVSGKGIAAAVLMASMQASLRSQVVRTPGSLAALIGDLNKAAYSFSTSDKYSTLFCGLLDIRARKLTYVNAGQVRPMLLRSGDGQVERLDGNGFPVGLLDLSQYDQAEVLLQSGDAVVCFSDGISEATNVKNEMWNESEVENIVRTCRGLSAEQIIDVLVQATDRFTGEAEQADDMTVVAIRL
jgi:serine phosphatase RsbU (regulator of sigma subunit)